MHSGCDPGRHGSFWQCGTHFCCARQSGLAVQAVLTGSRQAPPVPTDVWRQVLHAASGVAGVAAQAVAAHSVAQGAAVPVAPVPLHAQPSSVSVNVL